MIFFIFKAYFQILNQKSIEKKLKMLISYVPLLKSQTFDLKRVYFSSIRDVFSECMQLARSDLLLECYELSLISYLHPAFDEPQQDALRKWLTLFENFLVKLSEQKKNSVINNTNGNQPTLIWNNQTEKVNAIAKQLNILNR